jgi:DNA-directed RNA polymerase specialized sigma24 family protein
MARKQHRLRAFWREIDDKVRLVSRYAKMGSKAVSSEDRAELCQDTMIDIQKFVEGRLAKEPQLPLDQLKSEALAWGRRCFTNNLNDLIRKHNRRAERIMEIEAKSNEVEGFLDFSYQRIFTPHDKLEALALIEEMRAGLRSARDQSICDTLVQMVHADVDLHPQDVQLLAGVTAKNVHRFRMRAAGSKGE